jgi:hypothetical protein
LIGLRHWLSDIAAAAFRKPEAHDSVAMPAFASFVGVHPDDALANFHL